MNLSNPKLNKISVLIVEDMQPAGLLMKRMIATLGVTNITCCQDAEEGYAEFCKKNFDIIITDWHLPGMSGLEFLQKIRKSETSPNKHVPVIMTTGYNARERILTCRDEGVTEYLVKPFQAEDLLKRFAAVINTPRDFIESTKYIGPDRRRTKSDAYTGTYKRRTDTHYAS